MTTLEEFLIFLAECRIRYKKDFWVDPKTKIRYNIVIESFKIAIGDMVEDNIEQFGYTFFKITDLDNVKLFISEKLEMEQCPICGDFVRVVENHWIGNSDCKKKYEIYKDILKKLMIKEKEIPNNTLVPLIYQGIKIEEI